MTEIEESLPVGGYRIRSLKDVDTGFNYAILPDQHAQGSYEIELVIQRIAPPVYVDQLRPSLLSTEWRAFYASLLCKAVQALKDGRAADVQEIVSFLAKQPLPTFAELKRQIKMMPAQANDIKTEAIADLKSILTPVIMAQPFDAGPYVKKYEDVAQMVEKRGIEYARLHYAHHGYFEGRSPHSEACDASPC